MDENLDRFQGETESKVKPHTLGMPSWTNIKEDHPRIMHKNKSLAKGFRRRKKICRGQSKGHSNYK